MGGGEQYSDGRLGLRTLKEKVSVAFAAAASLTAALGNVQGRGTVNVKNGSAARSTLRAVSFADR